MKSTVVIPTYNERENLGALVDAITVLSDDLRVIIVDDNSPDGTGEIADALAAKYDTVDVIHRQGKGGRGSACIAGFRRALQDPDVAYVLEMDADFSHDPRDILRLIGALSASDAATLPDVAIGSRYLPGSKIINWGVQRHVFSRISNAFARFLLGVPICDYTNGYRCYTRRALEVVDFDRIEAHGYIVLSEMAYQLHCRGIRFVEIPIVFVNRRRGSSNTNLREITEAFTSVIRLRLKYSRG